MKLNVLVESMDAVALARAQCGDQNIYWYSTSPFVYEALASQNQSVKWLEDFASQKVADACGLVSLSTVAKFEAEWRKLGNELNWHWLDRFLAIRLHRLITVLAYKQYLLANWVQTTPGRKIVVGHPALLGNAEQGGVIEQFETLFSVLAREAWAHETELICEERYDKTYLYKYIDQPSWTGRVLSFSDTSVSQLVWRSWSHLLRQKQFSLSRAHLRIIVGRENETIREMLPHLIARRCSIEGAPTLPAFSAGNRNNPVDEDRLSSNLMEAALEQNLPSSIAAIAPIVAARFDNLCRWLVPAREAAGKSVQAMRIRKSEKTVYITNSVGSLKQHAFAAALAASEVPIVVVQHGVSAGLTKYHAPIARIAEPPSGDVYLVATEHAAEFLNIAAAPNAANQTSTVNRAIGLSAATRQTPRSIFQRLIVRAQIGVGSSDRVVLYVPSALQNNLILNPYSTIDRNIFQRMKTIIREVLPEVSGVPVVKLYSTRRYRDPDPFRDRDNSKVKILSAGDFRYMRTAADMIIVESALSTLGWAFGSDKPMIFVYDPSFPIDDEVIEHLKQSIFFVTVNGSKWSSDLLNLLNQPESKLMQRWTEMKTARDHFTQNYIFGPRSPGRNGAENVLEFLDQVVASGPSLAR